MNRMARVEFDDIFFRRETLLTADDHADIECSDCIGCENSCCRELSASITLDSYDMALLKKGLTKSFDEFLAENLVELRLINGAVVPILGNKPDKSECVFLREGGRCSIHPYRAGICRMYPLARLWQGNGNFAYYLQPGECTHRATKSTKVADWLGYEDTEAYEKEVKAYHARLKEYRMQYISARTPEEKQKIQENFFNRNFREDTDELQ